MKNSIEYLLQNKLINLLRLNCKKEVKIYYIVHYPLKGISYIVKTATAKEFFDNYFLDINDKRFTYTMSFLTATYAYLECDKLNKLKHKN